MKKSITYQSLFSIAITLFLTVCSTHSWAGGNYKDPAGLRQGYWVITGSMTGDRSYKPEATVEEGNYKDDLREGTWKKYWPNGNKRSEINFTLGKPHGLYKIFYQNGKLEEVGFWDDGVNTGDFKRYYDSGNMQQNFHFNTKGKRNGTQYYYHENGKLALEVEIVNGQESGVMKRYNDDGELIEEKVFNKGKVEKVVVLNKEKAPEAAPKPDAHNPQIGKTAPSAAGKTNEAYRFDPNGFNTLYDANGSVIQSGEFKNGKLYNGKWYRYNSSGILVKVDLYRKGRYIGEGIEESK